MQSKIELRNVRMQLCKRTGEVYKAICSCPAGKSGYCNHVMALLYEIAEYSLNQLTEVPQEKSLCKCSQKVGSPWEQVGCKRNCHENNPN